MLTRLEYSIPPTRHRQDKFADASEVRTDKADGSILAFAALSVIVLASLGFYWLPWSEAGIRNLGGEFVPAAIVLGIAAWLAWRARDALPRGRAWWPGYLCILFLGAAWLLAVAADILAIQGPVLPLIVLAGVLAHFGPGPARAMAFPVAFSYFAMPPLGLYHGALLAMTTAVSGAVTGALGIPVLVEGNLITVPSGRFEIADGCAGQGFFLYAGATAALYGYLRLESWTRRLILFLAGLAIALIMNWVRVTTLIVIGHVTQMQHYFVRVEHETLGWGLFALAMLALFLFGGWLEKGDRGGHRDRSNVAPVSSAWSGRRIASLGLTLGALAAAPAVWALTSKSPVPVSNVPEIRLPPAPEGWALTINDPTASDHPVWRPAYAGSDAAVTGRYSAGHAEIDVWLLLYATQSQGKELVNRENRIADSENWLLENSRVVHSDPPMNEIEIQARNPGPPRRVVRWWYEVGGWNTHGKVGAKMRQVAARLTGRQEAALVALSAPCDPDCSAARDRLNAFTSASAGALRASVYGFRYPEEGR